MADSNSSSAGTTAPQSTQLAQTPANAVSGAGDARDDAGENNSDGRGHKRSRGHGARADNGKPDGPSRNGGSRRPREKPRRDFKRRRIDNEPRPAPSENSLFTAEEIAAEVRRPKHKVAVMIGYSGTGYRGMQINAPERTIEGDLFSAFVSAGVISRANADDHRKSSLVRCARTDKGVHAAGNVISLKLIIEDGIKVIMERINAALPPQIRIWGIQQTNGKFSCYQACDSRWYEYLLPSYSLLPPHPDSYMWGKLVEAAKEKGTYDEFEKEMQDVKGFWEDVDTNDIKPILDKLDPEVLAPVLEYMHASQETFGGDVEKPRSESEPPPPPAQPEPAAETAPESQEETPVEPSTDAQADASPTEPMAVDPPIVEPTTAEPPAAEPPAAEPESTDAAPPAEREFTPVELALRDIKAAYVAAKRRWRVTPERMQRLQANLDEYCGTNNFFNYTVAKAYGDASAKRHIRSFTLNPEPIIIGSTEWLSLKVHGQSFMMHQIRKMVGAATLMVRCATPIERIKQTYENKRIAIPKAPGLGLLLERPVFDAYNKKAREELKRPEINFDQYPEIPQFKQKFIYNRIFEVEEKENTFHGFYSHVDNFRSEFFLWLTANGITENLIRPAKALEIKEVQEDEDEDPENGEG